MTIAQQETFRMTAEQYLQLGEDPPGVRLELVNGEIVARANPATAHAYVVSQLLRLLGNYIHQNGLGVIMSDTDLVLTRYDVRRPDVYYFRQDRVHLIGDGPVRHPPDLAVEVLSPGSLRTDRIDKPEAYRSFGIPFYWIIDPQGRSAKAFKMHRSKYVAAGSGVRQEKVSFPPFEGFELRLAELWWPPKLPAGA